MKIFISYGWKNGAERAALAQELRSNPDWTPIYDRKDIPVGKEIHAVIAQLLAECDCLVALITNESLGSFELRDELTRAHALRKCIIPVVESQIEMEALPWFIREIRHIRYDPQDFDRVMSEIEDALRHVRPRDAAAAFDEEAGVARAVYDPLSVSVYACSLGKASSLLDKYQYMLLMVGYTCCLKTTIARRLSKLLRVPMVETSCLDKCALSGGREREARYKRALRVAEVYFNEGLSAVVDGTFLSKSLRRPFYELACSHQIDDVVIVHASYSDKEIVRSKVRYKECNLAKPHRLCIEDFDKEKLENPTNDEIEPGRPVSIIHFDSTRFTLTLGRERSDMARIVESLLRESLAIGKLCE